MVQVGILFTIFSCPPVLAACLDWKLYAKLPRLRLHGGALPLSRTIDIVEVSPRDGLQNEAAVLTTAEKAERIGRAIAAGARRIEAVSFGNPKRVPRMAE